MIVKNNHLAVQPSEKIQFKKYEMLSILKLCSLGTTKGKKTAFGENMVHLGKQKLKYMIVLCV